MMSRQEVYDDIYKKKEPVNGCYTDERTYGHQEENAFCSPLGGGKVYMRAKNNKNVWLLGTALVAMVMLIFFAMFFMIIVAGPNGWIGFGIASLTVFLISTVTIDKIGSKD